MQCWDAAALLKLYFFEPDSDWFIQVARVNPRIITSDVARVEIFSSLCRKEKEMGLPAGGASSVIVTTDQRLRDLAGLLGMAVEP